MSNATLTFEQEGRPSFTIAGASGELRPERDQNLAGWFDDPTWGHFEMSGRYQRGHLKLHIESRIMLNGRKTVVFG